MKISPFLFIFFSGNNRQKRCSFLKNICLRQASRRRIHNYTIVFMADVKSKRGNISLVSKYIFSGNFIYENYI